ncbi:hypothetical protein MOOTH_09310 [Moorella thermoacetica]|nr:hypothetical protein MOOTH_09310 [Moorella thermoacetica]
MLSAKQNLQVLVLIKALHMIEGLPVYQEINDQRLNPGARGKMALDRVPFDYGINDFCYLQDVTQPGDKGCGTGPEEAHIIDGYRHRTFLQNSLRGMIRH